MQELFETRTPTLKNFHGHYERKTLGHLIINHPAASITTHLSEVYKHVLEKTTPEKIEGIVLFGSALWKNTPRQARTHTTKKYWLWGPEKHETTFEPYKKPSDIDVLVITKKEYAEQIIKPLYEDRGLEYGPLWIFKSGPAHYKTYDNYGFYFSTEGLPIHIAYRTPEQLKTGVASGDSLSQSIRDYAIPLTEEQALTKLFPELPVRKHFIDWKLTDTLNGEIN